MPNFRYFQHDRDRDAPRRTDRSTFRGGFNQMFGPSSDQRWRERHGAAKRRTPDYHYADQDLAQRDEQIERQRQSRNRNWQSSPSFPQNSSSFDGFGGINSNRYPASEQPHHNSQHAYQRQQQPYHHRRDNDSYNHPAYNDRSAPNAYAGTSSQRPYHSARRGHRASYANLMPEDEIARPRSPPPQFNSPTPRTPVGDSHAATATAATPTQNEEASPRAPRVELRKTGALVNQVMNTGFHDSENMRSPKRKKHVPGGRIPKYLKAQEYDAANLYCDYCELPFYDINAKALHDKSRKHQREVQFSRAEASAKAADDARNERKFSQETVETRAEAVSKASGAENLARIFATSKDVDIKNLPKSFKEWAARSLREAKKTADEEGDPSILQAVRKEIVVECQYHTKNFTILQESWDRRDLATGILYRPSVQIPRDIVISKEQAKAALAPKPPMRDDQTATEAMDQEPAAPSSNSQPLPETNENRWVSGGTEGELSVREVERNRSPNIAEEHERELTNSNGMGSHNEDGESSDSDRSDMEETPEYPEMKDSFRVPHQAMYMYYSSPPIGFKDTYRKLFSSRFEELKKAARKTNRKQKASIEPLMEEFQQLSKSYQDGLYEFANFRQKLLELIEKFEQRGTRIGTLQRCLEMLICSTIDEGKFEACNAPCEKLMKLYPQRGNINEADAEFIAYWVISLLFRSNAKGDTAASRKRLNGSRIVELQGKFRDIPRGACRFEQVRTAIHVVRAVMSNDYISFFKIRNRTDLHEKANGRSRYIMDGLVSFVRERALVSMTRKGKLATNLVFGNPNHVPMAKLLSNLEFSTDDIEDGNEEAMKEAREFIDNLPGSYIICNRDGEEVIPCESRFTPIQNSLTVDAEAVSGWNRNAWGELLQARK